MASDDLGLIEKSTLQDTADAIREMGGSRSGMEPGEFANAIRSIPTTVEDKRYVIDYDGEKIYHDGQEIGCDEIRLKIRREGIIPEVHTNEDEILVLLFNDDIDLKFVSTIIEKGTHVITDVVNVHQLTIGVNNSGEEYIKYEEVVLPSQQYVDGAYRAVSALRDQAVLSVNGIEPDDDGNVEVPGTGDVTKAYVDEQIDGLKKGYYSESNCITNVKLDTNGKTSLSSGLLVSNKINTSNLAKVKVYATDADSGNICLYKEDDTCFDYWTSYTREIDVSQADYIRVTFSMTSDVRRVEDIDGNIIYTPKEAQYEKGIEDKADSSEVATIKADLSELTQEDEYKIDVTLQCNGIITENGEVREIATSYRVSNLLDIGKSSYVFVTAKMDYSNLLYAFYDENETFISGYKASTLTTYNHEKVDVPTNAKYIRLGSTNSPDWALSGVAISVKCIKELTEKVNGVFDTRMSKNLYNEATAVDGYLKTDGTIQISGDWRSSDFIKVEGIANVLFSVQGTQGRATGLWWFFTLYDADKNIIRQDNSGANPYNIESGVVYIRFSFHGSSYTLLQVESGVLPTTYEEYGQITVVKPSILDSKWNDKKWVCIGDSLTDVNSRTTKHYYDYVAEKTGIVALNYGVSGTGYKRTEENNTAFYQRASSIPTDVDVITIFGSGNDLSLTLGTPTDTGTDTVCGCINKTIDELIKKNPRIVLGIVSPTPWVYQQPTIDDSNAMAQYVEALRNICKIRSLPYLDLYHNSLLRPWTEEGRQACYTKDDGNGVHPDENGHKLIAPRFKAFLETLLL